MLLCTRLATRHVGLRPLSTSSYSSIDPLEVAKFSKAAGEWWNPRGDFELLHRMNPLRVSYMRRNLLDQAVVHQGAPFKGLKMLDVGCGGGLLSESLARLGATVTAIDASKENIGIAKSHAAMDPALRKVSLSYECTTAESLEQKGETYDVVCSMEVMEHVKDPQAFVKSCANLVKPNGHLFLSTINRTLASYVFTILFAERVLRLVPPGTHDHDKYVTPKELAKYLQSSNCSLENMSGIGLNPILKEWFLEPTPLIGDEPLMNYIVTARKIGTTDTVTEAIS